LLAVVKRKPQIERGDQVVQVSPKVVRAELNWVPAAQGGSTKPPPGPWHAAPVRFESARDQRRTDESTLLVYYREPLAADHRVAAHVWFVCGDDAPEDELMPGAAFRLMKGRRVVGRGRVVSDRVDFDPPPYGQD
jgi:hypothetical protein